LIQADVEVLELWVDLQEPISNFDYSIIIGFLGHFAVKCVKKRYDLLRLF